MNQNLQDELTEATAKGFQALIDSFKAMTQEMWALRTIHERTASRMVSGVVGEHGLENVEFLRPGKPDVQAAILDELRAIRGLLEKQYDETPVYVFSPDGASLISTTKGAIRAEEAKKGCTI